MAVAAAARMAWQPVGSISPTIVPVRGVLPTSLCVNPTVAINSLGCGGLSARKVMNAEPLTLHRLLVYHRTEVVGAGGF